MAQQFVCAGGNGSATGQNAFACGNDATASGDSSSASGYHSTASGGGGTASGAASTASGFFSTALGFGSTASGDSSTALGYGSTASGYLSAALGSSTASGDFSTASGYLSTASGEFGTASGTLSTASGNGSTASGFSSYASGSGSAAYGNGASAGGLNGSNAFTNAATVAIGRSAQAGATGSGQTNATALGDNALANVANGTALGQGTSVTEAGGVALGQGTAATRAGLSGAAEVFSGAAVASTNGAVSVGTAGGERQITNLAGGTQDTDAVNLRQLRSVGGNLATALGGGARFNATTGAFTGPSYTVQGTTYGNVGGAVTALDTAITANAGNPATSTANLTTLGTTTAGALGGGTTYNAASGITGLGYALNGSGTPYTNVVSGLQALASGGAGPVQYATSGTASNALNLIGTGGPVTLGNVAAGTVAAGSTQAVNGGQLFATNQQIAALQSGIGSGGVGLVQQEAATRTITVGAATNGSLVSIAGTQGDRRITGVAPGTLAAGSTDAVNGNQLFATNQQGATNAQNIATTNQHTASAFGGGAGADASGLLTAPSYAIQGGTYNNVGGALGALDQQTTTNTRNIAGNTADIAAIHNGQSGPFRADGTGGLPAAQAGGANAVAGGFGSVASGGSATAIGTNARALQFGATAVGAGAVALGDPTTAVGYYAAATGNEASAFGGFATASGGNSTALGRSATADGTNAVAVGAFASAAQDNSVAIGTGVATTRANQVAIGSSSQTYTLAGIGSAQSLAAQTGPSRFVTTDASGNLATANFGPSDLGALDGRVGALEAGLNGLSHYAIKSRKEARRGIAAVAATAPVLMPSLPGRTTIAVKAAGYRGEYGTGFTVAHRLDTALPTVLFGSYSNGSGRDHVVSGGAGIEF